MKTSNSRIIQTRRFTVPCNKQTSKPLMVLENQCTIGYCRQPERQGLKCVPSIVFLKLSEEFEKNGGVSNKFTSKQSNTSSISGSLCTMGRSTFPAGFRLIGPPVVPEG